MRVGVRFSILFLILIFAAVLLFAYYTYKDLGLPFDELEPISCKYYREGMNHYHEEEYEEAIIKLRKFLEEAEPENSEYSWAYERLISSYMKLKRYDELEALIRKDIQKRPKDSFYYARLIELYFDLKRYDEAKRLTRESARLFPDDSEIQHYYACILNQEGEYKRAEEILKKILETKGMITLCLAYALYKQGREKEAEDLLKVYYQRYSEDFWNKRTRDRDFAGRSLSRLVAKFTGKKEPSMRLELLDLKGWAYLKYEPEEAIRIFKSVLREEPKRVETLRGIAKAYELLEDEKKAKEMYEYILGIEPEDWQAKEALKKWEE